MEPTHLTTLYNHKGEKQGSGRVRYLPKGCVENMWERKEDFSGTYRCEPTFIVSPPYLPGGDSVPAAIPDPEPCEIVVGGCSTRCNNIDDKLIFP